MKKLLTLSVLSIIFLFPCAQVFAQKNGDSIEFTPSFKNQGEQENYWAKQLFQKEYKEQHFDLFPLKIIIRDGAFIFSGDSLFVGGQTAEIKALFLKGLLYPTLIGGNAISNIEELQFTETSPKRKRFRFILHKKGVFNPTVCFFELTNVSATQTTSLIEFIEDAKLTFFKQGWIMI